jgi:hypothetical protein
LFVIAIHSIAIHRNTCSNHTRRCFAGSAEHNASFVRAWYSVDGMMKRVNAVGMDGTMMCHEKQGKKHGLTQSFRSFLKAKCSAITTLLTVTLFLDRRFRIECEGQT